MCFHLRCLCFYYVNIVHTVICKIKSGYFRCRANTNVNLQLLIFLGIVTAINAPLRVPLLIMWCYTYVSSISVRVQWFSNSRSNCAFTQGRTAELETSDGFQSAITAATPTPFEAPRSLINVRRKVYCYLLIINRIKVGSKVKMSDKVSKYIREADNLVVAKF